MDIEYRNDTREIGIICSACIIYSFLLEKILMIKKEEKISNLFKYYFDIRMIRILLLGAISGFPWVLIGSSLSLWLKEAVSYTHLRAHETN